MLLATADVNELASYLGTQSLMDIKDRFAAMEVQDVPDALTMPSLAVGYIRTGDFVYLPMGSMTVCKTISSDSFGIRPGLQLLWQRVAVRRASFLMGALRPRIVTSLCHEAGLRSLRQGIAGQAI